MRAPTIFTPEIINRILVMKAARITTAEIARVIGTTPNSLRARCSQLKLRGREMKETDFLRQLCEHLQDLRDCALAINDRMRLSAAGDCFTYEGGMNAIETFRDKEAEIVSFLFEHGAEDEEDDDNVRS